MIRFVAPSATELYEMIREAAYYRAEKRGFAPGLEAEDWAQAEAEVIERLRRANGAFSAAAATESPISLPSAGPQAALPDPDDRN